MSVERIVAPPVQYPPERDILFVLGAGASLADGSPLQTDVLPRILSQKNRVLKESPVASDVKKFMRTFYCWDDGHYPTLEAVFGFLDHFISEERALSREYSTARLRAIKEGLVRLIFFVTGKTTRKPAVYTRFWSHVAARSNNISVLTLNYDSLLESGFPDMYAKNVYIDYCLPFLNESPAELPPDVSTWVNPQRMLWKKEGLAPSAIKILKAHGSLNWKYCPCCGQVLLTPWITDIELTTGRFDQYTYCPHDSFPFTTVIVPPTFGKRLNHPVISRILNEAASEMRVSKKVVFIGYSMREPDVHIKALLHVNLHENTKVIVVDKNVSSAFRLRYQALGREIKFINASFEELVENDRLAEEVFSV